MKEMVQNYNRKLQRLYCDLFRASKLRTSIMLRIIISIHLFVILEYMILVTGRNRPLCAVHGAGRAFASVHAGELLGLRVTLKSSKLFHSQNQNAICVVSCNI